MPPYYQDPRVEFSVGDHVNVTKNKFGLGTIVYISTTGPRVKYVVSDGWAKIDVYDPREIELKDPGETGWSDYG